MFALRKWVALAVITGGAAYGAPALTTIQDTLYRADGTRFNGTAYITWTGFDAADTTNIAPHSLSVSIVNGFLRVQLVPGLNGAPVQYYTVRYNSGGKIQFTEVWGVPPSNVPLRVQDVRINGPAPGTVVASASSPIQITDVSGLQSELNLRPLRGPAFAASRAAVLNSNGQLDAAAGNLTDCLHVDGTSGPCGAGGAASYSDAETPAGSLDGLNSTFTLSAAPSPAASLSLYRNGLLMLAGTDYTLTGSTVTFQPASIPQPGDLLQAYYRKASAGPIKGGPPAASSAYPSPQILCNGTGITTGSRAPIPLAACTFADGVLQPGDRVEVDFRFSHDGTVSGFSSQLLWNGTTIFSRPVLSSEPAIVCHAAFQISSTGTTWDLSSWGALIPFVPGFGSLGGAVHVVTLQFIGGLSGGGSDVLHLQAYTVTRYPAQ